MSSYLEAIKNIKRAYLGTGKLKIQDIRLVENACKKQIPAFPIVKHPFEQESEMDDKFLCPECYKCVEKNVTFCSICGQRIKWDECNKKD